MQLTTSQAVESLRLSEWICHVKELVYVARLVDSEYILMPSSMMSQVYKRVEEGD